MHSVVTDYDEQYSENLKKVKPVRTNVVDNMETLRSRVHRSGRSGVPTRERALCSRVNRT